MSRLGSNKAAIVHPLDGSVWLRFWDNIHIDASGCWLWLGATNDVGYGVIGANSRNHYVHRLSYAWFVGAIPPEGDLTIDHLCRTTLCANPDHLELVSRIENFRRGHEARKRAVA